jgi:hypothetical protein
MEWLIALLLVGLLVYLVKDELTPTTGLLPRKRLCDYLVSGSVYEDIPSAIQSGKRLLEVHVYSDERDQPVVAKKQQNDGYDFAEDNVSFEQVCVDIVNDAFPSKDPFILSIVPHTDKTIVLNRVAEHLKTTVRKHLIPQKDLQQVPIDALANKLILVSGHMTGTALEPLVNMSWDESGLRRLSVLQATSPRDPEELKQFNEDFITMIVPDGDIKISTKVDHVLGSQWNFYSAGPSGFVEKTSRV